MWLPGEAITVKFLDGDPAVQTRVQQYAADWTAPGRAGLSLDFAGGDDKTDIRISFQEEGSWSALGRSCRYVTDQSEPTMNYGWLDANSTTEEIQRVVRHEFGHAMGLIHEHQNPAGGIKWNRQVVIDALSGPPNNWSEEQIEFNVLKPAENDEHNYTKLDPESIMLYAFPPEWTENGFAGGSNTDLSATDVAFIHEQYP
jgi:serralysin